MSEARMLRPDRRQTFLDAVDLESQLSEDHLARTAWAFVETLHVSPLESAIKSREVSCITQTANAADRNLA